MRNIGFRAISINVPDMEGQWVTTDEIGFVNFFHALKEGDLDEKTLGEKTGLHDKNGKEIWEGDLFGKMGGDVERPNDYEIHARVYFDEELGAFCIDDNRGGWEYLFDYLNKPKTEKEVIGNTYENPNLLEVKG